MAVSVENQLLLEEWENLVSVSNWKKGRIISDWSADEMLHNDEQFACSVGGITASHAKRLRQVWERFGTAHTEWPRCQWSHFLAALDWDDAHKWLTFADSDGLSVQEMRERRWASNDS